MRLKYYGTPELCAYLMWAVALTTLSCHFIHTRLKPELPSDQTVTVITREPL